MITDEQIKNLKSGDIVLVEAKVNLVTAIGADVTHGCISHKLPFDKLYPVPEQPKHDPCRLFREGDEVRIIEKDGRTVHDPLNGGIWRVARNERTGGAHEMSVLVNLIYEDEKIAHQIHVPFCFLELVTPVEELNPYSIIVQPEGYLCVRIMKGTKIHSSIPFDEEDCICRTLEEAKAAAETECKRLNAEHKRSRTMTKSCTTCRQYILKHGAYRCACIFNEKGTPDKPDTPDFCSFYEIVAEAGFNRLNAEHGKEQK